MSTPLVSIVMPTYRRPAYLREALASAVGQTYSNLQIIVRDNASGDETAGVVRSFSDRRIEFLQADKTGSAWENGSECVKRVRGVYLFPLCDDDHIGENYVEALVQLLEADPTVLVAYGATCVIDEHGVVTSRLVPKGTYTCDASEIVSAWRHRTIPLASGINYLARKSFLDSLQMRHAFAHGHHSDNAVFLSAGIRGKVGFTDQCVFYYRKYAGNSWRAFRFADRLAGDRDLLQFVDAELKAETNVHIPPDRCRQLRRELQVLLAEYYQDVVQSFNLDALTAMQVIQALGTEPPKVYGLWNWLLTVKWTDSSAALRRALRSTPQLCGSVGTL